MQASLLSTNLIFADVPPDTLDKGLPSLSSICFWPQVRCSSLIPCETARRQQAILAPMPTSSSPGTLAISGAISGPYQPLHLPAGPKFYHQQPDGRFPAFLAASPNRLTVSNFRVQTCIGIEHELFTLRRAGDLRRIVSPSCPSLVLLKLSILESIFP